MMDVETGILTDNKGFRIQVISDLHIEFGVIPQIQPQAPHLALLGGIHVWTKANLNKISLQKICKK